MYPDYIQVAVNTMPSMHSGCTHERRTLFKDGDIVALEHELPGSDEACGPPSYHSHTPHPVIVSS